MDVSNHSVGACLIIVNPAAGGGKAARDWSNISRQLTAAGFHHEVAFTTAPGHATHVCRDALRRGVDCIVAAGGDGTVNEVANGFFADDGTPDSATPYACLGVIPLGTGSDFARSLGIRRGIDAVSALLAHTTTWMDVGVAMRATPTGDQRRVFLNVADAGIGADTARRINQSNKRLGALGSYLVAAIQAINAYRPSRATITIDDGPPIRQIASIVVVANLRYFGGGMKVAPHARPDDGLFDVLSVGGATKRRLLLDLLPRVYVGRHVGQPAVHSRPAARIGIASEPPMPLELDGEPWGTTPVIFEVLPRAIQIVVPVQHTRA